MNSITIIIGLMPLRAMELISTPTARALLIEDHGAMSNPPTASRGKSCVRAIQSRCTDLSVVGPAHTELPLAEARSNEAVRRS
jgi:hypothetical protein